MAAIDSVFYVHNQTKYHNETNNSVGQCSSLCLGKTRCNGFSFVDGSGCIYLEDPVSGNQDFSGVSTNYLLLVQRIQEYIEGEFY